MAKPERFKGQEPKLEAIGDGVFAWLQGPGGFGIANAGVVVDDDGVTIIDTLMVGSQWKPFAKAVSELELPIKRVLLTHSHIDHVGGTKAFPHAAIYGSRSTSNALDLPMPIDAYKAFLPEFEDELALLGEIGTRAVTHLVDEAAQLTPRVEVLPAYGHTDGDLIAIVADADICFAGDLCCFGVTPLAFQGDPATWADMLDAIRDLAEVIVPGHGPIGNGSDTVDLQKYLRACVKADGDPTSLATGPWGEWQPEAYHAINVERAAMLARGDDSMPPSMARAIGLPSDQ